ncbi:MAG: type I methionyl aminopeptidase, partial [Armatimonadetes bacterium]|nr:type I methionyl aminopeptidase [Armatimonadota bacterium]
ASLEKVVVPGVSTLELDELAEEIIRKEGGRPAFKGYPAPEPDIPPFPGSICASINEQVVHGIPGLRRLQNGDIISIDTWVEFEGYFGDAAVTLAVGEVGEVQRNLIAVTKGALQAGINAARPGGRLSDISHAIESYVERNRFSVVRQFVGHGIGSRMHEEPQVPNFGPSGKGPRLEPGMTLALEPMVNEGTYEVVRGDDGWTVVTADGRLSGHFEHSVAITEGEPVLLTVL